MGRERHSWGTVVALSEYRKLKELPEILLVRSYWERLRAARPAPARREVDPSAIAPALGNAFILDQIAPGQAKFRVAGMHLCDLIGMEVRGMPLGTLFQVPAREQLATVVAETFGGQVTLSLRLRADQGLGRPALDAQMLLLPLLDRHGATTRALGCLVATGSIGFPPRRFELAEIHRRRILGGGEARLAPAEEPARSFAEPAARYRPRPALRVITNEE